MKPGRPLNLRLGEMALDDVFDLQDMMQPGTMLSRAEWDKFKVLIAGASDWAAAEIGRLNMNELTDVFKAIALSKAVEEDAAVPPLPETPSAPTASASANRKRRPG